MSTAPVFAIPVQRPLPRLAAVGALVDAALLAVEAQPAERRDVDDVGVGRMDADLRNHAGIGERHVRPRLAGVDRLVDAVALHDVAADARLAHADVDDVGVGLGDGDRADRGAVNLAVGHRRPRLALVGGLPQPAAGRAEVALVRPALHARDGNRPAAAIRADAAPLVGGEQRRDRAPAAVRPARASPATRNTLRPTRATIDSGENQGRAAHGSSRKRRRSSVAGRSIHL